MGICNSKNNISPQQKAQLENDTKQDKAIAAQMQKDNNAQQRILKLLLLGAGESGKSTLFKQMNHIYGKGFNDDDRRAYVTHVRNNVMLCLKALAENASNYGQLLPEVEVIANFIRSIEEIDSATLDQTYVQNYKQLWADPTVKLAWEHRAEFQIYGCAAYFLDKLGEIASPSYVPSQQDILQTRVRTTGIVENQFVVDGNKFSLYDVGGQRNERKKWIHCFENVTAVIFVAAISEYDQRLFEDEATNRVDEALKLFDEICNSRWFKDTSLLLFLNKRDLFEEKIQRVPLQNFFPQYNGPQQDAVAAQEWIAGQFKAKNRNPDKVVYCHVTCATDSDNVQNVFTAVKDIIIRNALRNIGIQ